MAREPIRTVTVPAGFEIADYGKGRGGGYHINGEKVDGVTTALGIIDGGKSGGMAWSAARIWLDGVCSVLGEEALVSSENLLTVQRRTPEQWESDLKERKLLHIHKWGAKTDLGTSIHDALEALAAGSVPTLSDFPEDEQPYIKAICGWWADNDPEVVHTELMVGSLEHGYAGRFDLLYEQNEQLILADLKTSKTVQPTHLIQLAAYKLALEECGYGCPNRMEVIHARPDGGYTVVDSKSTPEDFLNVLAAYRAFNSNKDALKAA